MAASFPPILSDHNLCHAHLQLQRQVAENAENKERLTELDLLIKARIEEVLPVYHTVSVQFADLHDTPERMLEKSIINRIVPWRESRKWFHWRLRRLLLEQELVQEIIEAAQDSLTIGEARERLRRWFIEDKGDTHAHVWDDNDKGNEAVAEWLQAETKTDSVVHNNINAVRRDAIVSQVQESIEDCPDSALDAVIGICQKLSITQRSEVVRILAQLDLSNDEQGGE